MMFFSMIFNSKGGAEKCCNSLGGAENAAMLKNMCDYVWTIWRNLNPLKLLVTDSNVWIPSEGAKMDLFEPFFEPCLKIMTFKQILKPLVETSSCWNHPWCELMKHPFKWLNLIQTLPQSTSCPKKTLPFWSSIGLASLLEVAEDGFESSPAKVLSSILSEPYWKTRYPQSNIIN